MRSLRPQGTQRWHLGSVPPPLVRGTWCRPVCFPSSKVEVTTGRGERCPRDDVWERTHLTAGDPHISAVTGESRPTPKRGRSDRRAPKTA